MKTAIGAAVATGTAIGAPGAWETGVAYASTHHASLQYSCTFPVIGSQPITAVVDWSFPDTVTVGTHMPPVPFTVTVQVPSSDVEAAHDELGIYSASGYGSASAKVIAPQGNIPVKLTGSVPSTNVPAYGSITVVVHSTFPSLTPTQPGVAKITLGALTMHITPRDAGGNVWSYGPITSPITSTCTLAPGQDNVVMSLLINPVPQITTTAPRQTTPKPPPTPTNSTMPTPTPTNHPHPTPTLTRMANPDPPSDHRASWAEVAVIAGVAAVVGGGAVWLLARLLKGPSS